MVFTKSHFEAPVWSKCGQVSESLLASRLPSIKGMDLRKHINPARGMLLGSIKPALLISSPQKHKSSSFSHKQVSRLSHPLSQINPFYPLDLNPPQTLPKMYTSSIIVLAASASFAIARPQEASSASNTLFAGTAALVQGVHSDGSPYVEVKTATSFTGTVYTTAIITNTKTVDCTQGTLIFNGTTAYPTTVSTLVPVPSLPTTIMSSNVPQQTGESVPSIPPPTLPGFHGPPANGTLTYSYDPSSAAYPSAPTGGAAAQSSATKASHSTATAASATSSTSGSDNSFGQGTTSAASASFAATEGTLVSLIALVVAGLVL